MHFFGVIGLTRKNDNWREGRLDFTIIGLVFIPPEYISLDLDVRSYFTRLSGPAEIDRSPIWYIARIQPSQNIITHAKLTSKMLNEGGWGVPKNAPWNFYLECNQEYFSSHNPAQDIHLVRPTRIIIILPMLKPFIYSKTRKFRFSW